jgi:UDP-N-acetylmuramoyl-L-alanyl-D-glutamate--2,6-diaminopimelate ligase
VELEALIRALAPTEVPGARALDVHNLAHDTRRVTGGTLFFCVPGHRVDGHDLAWEAIERGAVALVVERALAVDVPQLVVPSVREAMPVAADVFFGEPTRALEVVGVTGTNGKTTTSFLLHAILEAAGRAPGLVGTVEWIVGRERRPAPFTTPEAIELQRLFREMVDRGDDSAVVEASSHGSTLRRLDRVRFDALVFTNLSQDHLDLHGTMEDYFQAKRRLFTGPAPPPAAVNVGDEWGRRLAADLADLRRAPLVTFGLADDAEIRPDGLESGPAGSRFRAGGIDVETPLRGSFNVENVLGAIAAGILLDLDEDDIAAGIAAVTGVPGRFDPVDEGQPFSVLVDFAARCSRRPGGWRTGASSSSSARAATATGASARSWGASRQSSPTSRSSPPTTRAPRTRCGSSRTSSRAPGSTSRSTPTGGARSSARCRSPAPGTSSSSPGRATSRARRPGAS